MKKTAAIVFLLVYLMFASGLQMSLHYCGGKLAAVSLGYGSAQDACCAMKVQKSKCCHDQSLVLKINDQHVKVVEAFNGFRLFPAIENSMLTSEQVFINDFTCTDANMEHPPDDQQRPVFLMNCVFRI